MSDDKLLDAALKAADKIPKLSARSPASGKRRDMGKDSLSPEREW